VKRGQILQNENQSLTEMDGLEERFRFFAENVRDVMFIQDMNFRLIYVSPSVKSVFGSMVSKILMDSRTDVEISIS